jgi:hypothetical protein
MTPMDVRAVRIAIVLAAAWGGSIAQAQDWLDDMPTLERVALVAYQDGAATQDAHATQVARILILLRQAMAYRAASEPNMSAERQARLQWLDASYQQVELAIGEGLGKRSGGLSPAQVQQYYESRRHQKCALAECFDYWLKGQLEWWGAAKFRDRVLPMLMPCVRAQEFGRLVAQHAMSAPLVPETPALTRALTEAGTAAMVAMPAEACNESLGRDVDGDGLCSDWEARLDDVKPGAAVASSCGCVEPEQGNMPCDSRREYKKAAKGYRLYVDDAHVRVETGMQWTNAIPPSDCNNAGVPQVLQDGIAITVKNCKQNPRVVQFIHREQRLHDGTLEPGQYERSTGCTTPPRLMPLTDDRGPAWHPDGTPYYNSYRMDCDPRKIASMTIFDAPNFKEGEFDPERYLYWRATFVSFVLCNGEVVRQVRWSRTLAANKSGGLEKRYDVERNVMPELKDVKKLQCLSKQLWAPCSAMGQDPAACGGSP